MKMYFERSEKTPCSAIERGRRIAKSRLEDKMRNAKKNLLLPAKTQMQPIYTVYPYCCCLDGFDCSSTLHEKRQSDLILISGRDDGFALSLCIECLYDFAEALGAWYYRTSDGVFRRGEMSIEKNNGKAKCFFCLEDGEDHFKITCGETEFVLCNKCADTLVHAVYCSAVFKETFLNEFVRFRSVEKRRALFNREKNIYSYGNCYIYDDGQSSKISEQKEAREQKRKNLIAEYEKRVLNCRGEEKIKLTYDRKTARETPCESISFKRIGEIPCKTFLHDSETPSDFIIETDRENDNFCLSFSRDDLELVKKELRSVGRYLPLRINVEKGYKINYFRDFDGEYCYFCGEDKGEREEITFGALQFNMCVRCKNKILKNLSDIMRQ